MWAVADDIAFGTQDRILQRDGVENPRTLDRTSTTRTIHHGTSPKPMERCGSCWFSLSQGQPLKLSLTAKRKPALSPGGSKGSLRSSCKCVNPLPDKLASMLVRPVYLLNRSPEGQFAPSSQRGCGTSRSENLEAERNLCHRGCHATGVTHFGLPSHEYCHATETFW